MKNNEIKMVVSDLDGTLLRDDKTVSQTDLDTLKALGEFGVVRVAATGRTYYNLQVLPDDFPFDYIVFSSGAGVLNWKTKDLLVNHKLKDTEVEEIKTKLLNYDVDFHILKPIPDNHWFASHVVNTNNVDIQMLHTKYANFHIKMNLKEEAFGEASQVLVIIDDNLAMFDCIKKNFTGEFKIIRATSPINGKFIWMEFFPNQVSKAKGVEFLCRKLDINPKKTVAIGNDYNDIDLLSFTAHSFLVSNAPADLKGAFPNFRLTSDNMNSGFSKAVRSIVPYFKYE